MIHIEAALKKTFYVNTTLSGLRFDINLKKETILGLFIICQLCYKKCLVTRMAATLTEKFSKLDTWIEDRYLT